MLAVVAAALALTPALPPEPIEPPMTWIADGPSGTVYDTTAHFAIESDGGVLQCALDTATFTSCAHDYTTPVLGAGSHTLRARSRVVGAIGPEVSRTWTIAARPVQTPVPTTTPAPTAPPAQPTVVPTVTPAPQPPVALIADTRPAQVHAAAPLEPIDFSLLYYMNAKTRYTRFATLSVKRVPAGATITLACKGGCPRAKQTLTTGKGGTVKLSRWLRKRLKTGARLTISVTKPGMAGMTKTLTMRPERRPRIVTKTLR